MQRVGMKIRASAILRANFFLKARGNGMLFIQNLLFFLALNCIVFGHIDEMKIDLLQLQYQIPEAINRIEEDRCFLHSEKVILLEGQAYVETKCGNLVVLPMICFSQSGIFVPMGCQPSQPKPIWICRKCTLVHYYQPSVCERIGCGGTSFIVRYH
jgi:hypothetical protein